MDDKEEFGFERLEVWQRSVEAGFTNP